MSITKFFVSDRIKGAAITILPCKDKVRNPPIECLVLSHRFQRIEIDQKGSS